MGLLSFNKLNMNRKFSSKNFATVSTSDLPERVSEVIKAAAIERMIHVAMLRDVFFTDTSPGEGDSKYIYEVFDSVTAAHDRVEGVDWKYDSAGVTEGTADMLELAKGFKITNAANSLKKIAVRAAQTKACVDVVNDREDLKIATALRTSAALTSTVTAAGVLSGTSANPLKDLAEGKRKVKALTRTVPDTLLIEDVNLEELVTITGSNDWYELSANMVARGELPVFMGLKVVSLPAAKMTHGSAIICNSGQLGPLYVGEGHNTKVNVFDDEDAHVTKVQIWKRAIPVVVRADAGALLTGW